MYTKCKDHMNLFKNSNSLNVENCEKPMENFMHQMNRLFRLVKNNNKLNSLNVEIHER